MVDGDEIQRGFDWLEAHREREAAKRDAEWRRYDKERERRGRA